MQPIFVKGLARYFSGVGTAMTGTCELMSVRSIFDGRCLVTRTIPLPRTTARASRRACCKVGLIGSAFDLAETTDARYAAAVSKRHSGRARPRYVGERLSVGEGILRRYQAFIDLVDCDLAYPPL
jgi:hypothetical protein